MPILVDSNVILDILTEDPHWYDWSASTLEQYSDSDVLYINPIIYAEVSIRFNRIESLEEALPSSYFQRDDIPYEAAFLAGKCFLTYRKRGGNKTSPLPDFLIGAHAAVRQWTVLTRDKGRYSTYFPSLSLITP